MRYIKIFTVFSILGTIFSACSQTVSSDSQDLGGDSLTGSDTFLNTYPEIESISDPYILELYMNYSLLDLAYIYGHMRNEISSDYRIYLGKGDASVNDVKGYCTPSYYDICYMYNQMADPFTQYFDPNVAELVLKNVMETEEILGIGAEVKQVFDTEENYLVITEVYPNSPSAKAGLHEGDIIVTIGGIPITTVDNYDRMCTGQKGSTLQIVVNRDGQNITTAVTLDVFHVPSVKVHYEGSIPVIEILEFSGTTSNEKGTYGEFLEALQKTAGAKSTIIDLRRNPGGDTDHCNNVSGELLSQGDTIITDVVTDIDSVQGEDGWKYIQVFDTITYTANHDGIGRDRYYVLMESDSSASCAEIVLSAISVNKKSPIVGVTSYGKGIGQGVISKESGIEGLALITMLQGVDKNGNSYHDLGIVPDYPIIDPDEQMAKAVELATEMTAIRTAGYGTEKLYHFSKRKASESKQKIPSLRDLKMRYTLTNKHK